MKSFKKFIEEMWTRPVALGSRPNEYDEVQYQSSQSPRLSSLNDVQKYRNAIRTGKEKIIPAYKWGKVNNTDAANRSALDFKNLDSLKQRRVTSQFARNKVEMPIVHQQSGQDDHLVAGNTRASFASARGKPVRALTIREKNDQ